MIIMLQQASGSNRMLLAFDPLMIADVDLVDQHDQPGQAARLLLYLLYLI